MRHLEIIDVRNGVGRGHVRNGVYQGGGRGHADEGKYQRGRRVYVRNGAYQGAGGVIYEMGVSRVGRGDDRYGKYLG